MAWVLSPIERAAVGIGANDGADYLLQLGQNLDVDTASEDIWDSGGSFTWPSAAGATTVVSDSADDDGSPVGTGARTLYLEGVSSTYAATTETITLNGAGSVTATNQFLRINKATVITVGSGGTNAGNITIAIGGTTVAYIPAGQARTFNSMYTVPNDYLNGLLIKNAWVAVNTTASTGANAILYVRQYGRAWEVALRIAVPTPATLTRIELAGGIYVPRKADLYFASATLQNNTAVYTGIEGLLLG